MVAHVLRLKLRLLANAFRRSAWQIVGVVVGLIYGAAGAAFACATLIGLRLVAVDVAAPVVVVLGAVLVLGYLLVPLVLGVDDTLDPRRFALLGMPTDRLVLALALAALIGIPALVITAVAVAQVTTWSRDPFSVIVAVLAVPLIVAACVLGGRVTTSLAAFGLATRRAREWSGIIAVLGIVCLSPAIVLLVEVDWRRDGLDVVTGVAGVLSWTPLGAAWAAPAAAAAGAPGEALLKLLIAAGFVAVLWYAWRSLVALMLVTPQRESRGRSYAGLGWFARLPATSTGAIAARSLTYWARDARYGISLVVVPVVPAVMIVPLVVVGVPEEVLWLFPVPVMTLFLTWSIHNDVAFDHTAIWLHVAADTSGRADRIGRLVPALALGVPLVVVGSAVCAWGYGDPNVLPSLLGVSSAVLFSGLGLSSLMSAAFPYPAVRPGDNPFQQPQSGGTAASLIQGFSFLAIIVLAVPPLAFGGLALVDDPQYTWASLWSGLGIGLLVLVAGIAAGARIFDRRGPELLAFSMRN